MLLLYVVVPQKAIAGSVLSVCSKKSCKEKIEEQFRKDNRESLKCLHDKNLVWRKKLSSVEIINNFWFFSFDLELDNNITVADEAQEEQEEQARARELEWWNNCWEGNVKVARRWEGGKIVRVGGKRMGI